MFKKLDELINKKLELVSLELNEANRKLSKNGVWDDYCKEIGLKFLDIEGEYAITIDELLSISESVAKYVTLTRTTNIDWLLFKNGDKNKPRLKSDIRYIENIEVLDTKAL